MKFKKDTLYKIRFLDHALGEVVVICEICGWLLKQDKESATFTWWRIDSKCKETVEANYEPVSLIKSAIISCDEI